MIVLLLLSPLFLAFLWCHENFLLLRYFFYSCESFSTTVQIFLLPWEFFYCCENSFAWCKKFFLLWELFTWYENIFLVVRIFCLARGFFFPKKISGKPYHVACAQCCAKMTRGGPDYKNSLGRKRIIKSIVKSIVRV